MTAKKILAVLLAMALCFGLIACAGTEAKPTTAPTKPQATKPQATEPQETDTKPSEGATEPRQEDPTEPPTATQPPRETEPQSTQPPATTEPQIGTSDPADVTYEEYLAMSPQEQQAHYEQFPSLEAYIAWHNAALEEYEENQGSIEVTGGIDIGDFMTP